MGKKNFTESKILSIIKPEQIDNTHVTIKVVDPKVESLRFDNRSERIESIS